MGYFDWVRFLSVLNLLAQPEISFPNMKNTMPCTMTAAPWANTNESDSGIPTNEASTTTEKTVGIHTGMHVTISTKQQRFSERIAFKEVWRDGAFDGIDTPHGGQDHQGYPDA